MGLDITAYETVRFVQGGAEDFDGADGVARLWPNPAFPHATQLAEGIYEVGGESLSFRAGSYGGYNLFREHLSLAAIGAPPKAVWARLDFYRGCPFWELVHFSDCEGIISGEAARKLAKDFAEQRETFVDHIAGSVLSSVRADFFIQVYDQFAEAFSIAAESGAVRFW